MSTVFVIRERISFARDFEDRKSYGPIDLTGVASTFENAKEVIHNSMFAFDLNPDFPGLNWRSVGYAAWYCTTTDGTYVTEWWISGQTVQTKPLIDRSRKAMSWKSKSND